jgi:hypothetical protein
MTMNLCTCGEEFPEAIDLSAHITERHKAGDKTHALTDAERPRFGKGPGARDA